MIERIVTIDPRWKTLGAGKAVRVWLPHELSDFGVNAAMLPEPGSEPRRSSRQWVVCHLGTMRAVSLLRGVRLPTFAEAMELARTLDAADLGFSQVREKEAFSGYSEDMPLGLGDESRARALEIVQAWAAGLPGRRLQGRRQQGRRP